MLKKSSRHLCSPQRGTGQIGIAQFRTRKIGVVHFCSLEPGVAQIGIPQVSPPQRGTCHVCVPQIGAAQASVIEVRALQTCVAEIRLPKIGAPQRETLQLRMRKIGSFAALTIGLQPRTVLREDLLQLVERHLSEHRTSLRTIFRSVPLHLVSAIARQRGQ